jgi:hypothetical protein
MAYNIDFSGKDWNGRPNITAGNGLNLTSLTGEYKYFYIDGDRDAADNFTSEYQLRGIWIYGSITSPSSWRSTATAADTTLFLHLDFFQRGEDFNSYLATTIGTHIPLIHFRASETSTTKTLDPIYVNLNTGGQVIGNAMVRLGEGVYDDLAGGSGNAWSNANISVNRVYGTESNDLYSNLMTLEAEKSTAGADATNNLLATGIGVTTHTATTSEQIPTSTAGYIQATFNPFGKYGNINQGDLEFGMTDSADAATTASPKYKWVFRSSTIGEHTGFAIHNGTTVVASQAIQLGDVFKVQRDASGNFTYYKNGVSQGTGGTTNTGAMLGDFYLGYNDVNNRILNIRADIGAGEISPTFTNLVNVSTDY